MLPPLRTTRNTTMKLKEDGTFCEDKTSDKFKSNHGDSDGNKKRPDTKQGGPIDVPKNIKTKQNVRRKGILVENVANPCGEVTVIGLLIKKEPDSSMTNDQPKPSTSTDLETSNICINCKNVWNKLKGGKCRACIRYAQLHNGQERPAHVIEFARRKVAGDLNKNRLCTICHLKPIYYIGKCSACYDYARQHNGALRPARLIQRAEEKATGSRMCIVCKVTGSVKLSKRRCTTCYSYFKIHNGEDRPQHLFKRGPKIIKEVLTKCSSCKQMTNSRVKKGLCNACYIYAGNHNGQPRPAHIVNKPEGPVYKTCIVCKVSRLGARMRKGKCNTCYNFPRRHHGLERDTLLSAVKPTACSVCKVEVKRGQNMRCGKCYKCYKYAGRHNGAAHPSTREARCTICNDKLPIFCVTGKCLRCYMYAYRHNGEDRPPELFNAKPTRRRQRRGKNMQSPDPDPSEPDEVITDCAMTIKCEPDTSETTASMWEEFVKEEGTGMDINDKPEIDDDVMSTSEDPTDSLLKEESMTDIKPGAILNCFHLDEEAFYQGFSSLVKQEKVPTEESGDVS